MALVECLVDHNVSLYTHEICTVIRELRATVNFTCVYIYIIYLFTLYIMTISIGQVPGTLQLYSPTFGLNLAECWSMLNQEPGT